MIVKLRGASQCVFSFMNLTSVITEEGPRALKFAFLYICHTSHSLALSNMLRSCRILEKQEFVPTGLAVGGQWMRAVQEALHLLKPHPSLACNFFSVLNSLEHLLQPQHSYFHVCISYLCYSPPLTPPGQHQTPGLAQSLQRLVQM